MEEEELLLRSIERLIKLNVSDKEIIINLKQIGVEEEKARELIAKAKGQKAIPAEKEEEFPEELEKVVEEKHKKEERAESYKATESKLEKYGGEAYSAPNPAISELWKRGILLTVNQKLEEMKKLKKEIDMVLEERVRKVTDVEKKKIQTLMESQRDLLAEEIKALLESKATEVEEIIDIKIAEMNALNKEIKKNLETAQEKQKEQKLILTEFEQSKKELKQLKEKMLSEMNTDLAKSQSELEDTLEAVNEKLNEIDTRVDKTLQLETTIVDSLVSDTEAKIDKITEEKKEELVAEIEEEIEKMEGIRAEIEPEKIKEKIKKLEEDKEDLEGFKQAMSEEMQVFVSKELGKALKENQKELQEFKKEFVKQFEEEIDLKTIITERDNFEAFKKQFITTIEKNVEKFNSSIQEMNAKAAEIVKQFNVRAQHIDEKISELDRFEENFAKEMGIAMDKLVEKKGKKK